MRSREESIWGETSWKIYDKIKSWGSSTLPVGSLIPPREKHEWNKLKMRFNKYGVNMSNGGLILVIKWANAIMDSTNPIADKTGYNLIELTDELVFKYSEIIKNMNQDEWAEQSNVLKSDIVGNIEEGVHKILMK